MRKDLLKAFFILCTTLSASAQVTVSFDQLPTRMKMNATNGVNITDIGSKIYPSSVTKDILNVNLDGVETYQIVDSVGTIVLYEKVNSNKTVDLSSLASGIYFLVTEVGAAKISKL